MKGSTKGFYCKGCHTYFQLRRRDDGSYKGSCPRCGKIAIADKDSGSGTFVHTTQTSEKKKDRRLVNVWESYSGGRIIGRVDVGTPAQLLETQRYNGVTWYRIRTAEVTGWVSSSFIRKA